METIYFDYNATTPIREEVLEIMQRVSRDCIGNPSSAHMLGKMARACLDDARRKVAESLGAEPDEIVFTSGGSESDNLAIKGIAESKGSGHIVTSATEHAAVKRTCAYLERRGFEVTYLPVDRSGRVDPLAVRDAIHDRTILVTIMWANNETGQLQPVEKIAEVAHERGVDFHTDAVQAFGKVSVGVNPPAVDLLSISGHKIYAPKGVGALYVHSGTELAPNVHGGGQEMGFRSGTENLVGIAALGEACRLAVGDRERESRRIEKLRGRLEDGILSGIAGTRVSGDPSARLPNTSNVVFEGVEAWELLEKLDENGFAASGASACASEGAEPSEVLLAMGLSRSEALGAVRFSLGRYSKDSDIDKLLEILPRIVENLRTPTSRRRSQ